jgi:hypothetical protein
MYAADLRLQLIFGIKLPEISFLDLDHCGRVGDGNQK